jgi:hypothetical protein
MPQIPPTRPANPPTHLTPPPIHITLQNMDRLSAITLDAQIATPSAWSTCIVVVARAHAGMPTQAGKKAGKGSVATRAKGDGPL